MFAFGWVRSDRVSKVVIMCVARSNLEVLSHYIVVIMHMQMKIGPKDAG